MFCFRQCNNLINKILAGSLRVSYKDQKTSYQNLLETHNELMIHQRNLQVLMTEIYKIVNGVTLRIMNSLFEFQNNENNIKNFKVLSTVLIRRVFMELKPLHTERHPFGQNYHPWIEEGSEVPSFKSFPSLVYVS